MLATQVAYWNMIEQRRHNRETERLTAKQQEIDKSALAENKRHNLANESIGYQQASASLTSASAAWKNSSTNRFESITNRSRQRMDARLTRAKTQATKHSVAQGWVNAASSLIGNVASVVRAR